MDEIIRTSLVNMRSSDKAVQNKAFFTMLGATDSPVEWAYEVWDELVALLRDKDNHLRAISSQLLCNLAKSDPQGRMIKDFDALLNVTKDERFVTARHCLQAIWKVGMVGEAQKEVVIAGLERRFIECVTEKNCTLIRYDIVQGLRNLYDQVPDEQIRQKAMALIESEDDLKYRKKYATVWKPVSRT